MPRVLHILPHAGGGGEALVDMVARLEGYEHRRFYLSASQSPLLGAPSIAARRLGLGREAERADLVHVIGDMAAIIALRVIERRPSVFGTHGLHFLRRAHGFRAAIARRRLRAVVAAADRTICTSHAELDELAALVGNRAARLEHIPNGVAIPELSADLRASARAELGLEPRQVVALYLGRLEERKDPLVAVTAAERAAHRGSPIVLLVAGDGPLAEEVGLRSSETIRPLGFRPDADLLLRAADLLVMPSSREGLSLAVLEAMAHGLPAVVSDGPGNPEAVGDTGLVFPAGDVDALQEALEQLVADAAERRRLGSAARARAVREFALDRFLVDTDALFRAVVATATAPAGGGARA
jgi:glycosyltransferase involved in cell wall biosynthesis